jgi:hypothetical protein
MRVGELHGFDLSPAEARRLQAELASGVVAGPALELGDVRHVAGADVSTQGDRAYATVAVLDFPGLSVVEVQGFEASLSFPYVPGLLAFREIPSVVGALRKVEKRVDAVIFDAQGRWGRRSRVEWTSWTAGRLSGRSCGRGSGSRRSTSRLGTGSTWVARWSWCWPAAPGTACRSRLGRPTTPPTGCDGGRSPARRSSRSRRDRANFTFSKCEAYCMGIRRAADLSASVTLSLRRREGSSLCQYRLRHRCRILIVAQSRIRGRPRG